MLVDVVYIITFMMCAWYTQLSLVQRILGHQCFDILLTRIIWILEPKQVSTFVYNFSEKTVWRLGADICWLIKKSVNVKGRIFPVIYPAVSRYLSSNVLECIMNKICKSPYQLLLHKLHIMLFFYQLADSSISRQFLFLKL